MPSSRLIQIVPVRSRSPEGVGDYSRILAERLRSNHGVESSFLACTPLPPGDRLEDGWETIELERRGAAKLLGALERLRAVHGPATILLHLSAYGFHPKAVPLWLVSGLARWRRANPAQRLVTVFHELYATGPVWSSPFWLGWLQARCARRIQQLGDAGIATTRKNFADLMQWSGGTRELHWMPCFSNIGEIGDDRSIAASSRAPSLVIFGRSAVVDQVYRDGATALEAFVRANGVKDILDIGARIASPPCEVAGIPVRALGVTSAEALREELAKARFGLLAYDAEKLAKSGVFAAYCATGVVPLCISSAAGTSDGLSPGTQYVKLAPHSRSVAPLTGIDDLQDGTRAWYRPHSTDRTVSLIHRLIQGPGVAGDE